MKLKIKVPKDGRWPAHHQGKSVEVEVHFVKFEDGQTWPVNNLEAKVVTDGLINKLLGNVHK